MREDLGHGEGDGVSHDGHDDRVHNDLGEEVDLRHGDLEPIKDFIRKNRELLIV